MVLSLLTFLEGAPNPSICQSPKIRVVKIQVHQAKKKKKKKITKQKNSKKNVSPWFVSNTWASSIGEANNTIGY